MIRPAIPIGGAIIGAFIASRKGKSLILGAVLGAFSAILVAFAIVQFGISRLNKKMRNLNPAQANLIAEKICQSENDLASVSESGVLTIEFSSEASASIAQDISDWKQVLALSNFSYNDCKAVKNA